MFLPRHWIGRLCALVLFAQIAAGSARDQVRNSTFPACNTGERTRLDERSCTLAPLLQPGSCMPCLAPGWTRCAPCVLLAGKSKLLLMHGPPPGGACLPTPADRLSHALLACFSSVKVRVTQCRVVVKPQEDDAAGAALSCRPFSAAGYLHTGTAAGLTGFVDQKRLARWVALSSQASQAALTLPHYENLLMPEDRFSRTELR